jgi:hypothetical protein
MEDREVRTCCECSLFSSFPLLSLLSSFLSSLSYSTLSPLHLTYLVSSDSLKVIPQSIRRYYSKIVLKNFELIAQVVKTADHVSVRKRERERERQREKVPKGEQEKERKREKRNEREKKRGGGTTRNLLTSLSLSSLSLSLSPSFQSVAEIVEHAVISPSPRPSYICPAARSAYFVGMLPKYIQYLLLVKILSPN